MQFLFICRMCYPSCLLSPSLISLPLDFISYKWFTQSDLFGIPRAQVLLGPATQLQLESAGPKLGCKRYINMMDACLLGSICHGQRDVPEGCRHDAVTGDESECVTKSQTVVQGLEIWDCILTLEPVGLESHEI